MMKYRQDIFYDVDGFSHDEQEAILRKAHGICEDWWLDELDCAKSFSRQRVEDVSFEDAMSHFVPGALLRVIHRFPVISLDKERLEVVFRSMEDPVDYFLWIVVSLDRQEEIVAGLKQLGGAESANS